MRLLLEIPHSKYKIQWFHYNNKYILKIELGTFEQIFKIDETEITQIDELSSMVNGLFLDHCLNRFIQMRTDWNNIIQNK
ncbi:MAG: hypothetical protein HYU67_09475 [Flavobacteriia bacterium]|nr:hypothetical protein [Flavobacteriia bacterium]